MLKQRFYLNSPRTLYFRLPYLTAVLLEGMRLGNGLPIVPPRLVTEDVYYKDMVIPKVNPQLIFVIGWNLDLNNLYYIQNLGNGLNLKYDAHVLR